MNKTSKNLIYLRQRCEFCIEDIAEAIHEGVLTVEAWESGHADIGAQAISTICQFYGIQKSELVLLDLEK